MQKPIFRSEELLSTSWDRRIADDLTLEIAAVSGEQIKTVAEMRRFLAVKSYRELRERLERVQHGRTGRDAVRALAEEMRAYARERPALAAASFRGPQTDSPEWRAEGERLKQMIFRSLAECGLDTIAAERALAILRSLVRGFVMHEVTDSFVDTQGYDELYGAALDVFLAGLHALASRSEQP